MKKVILSAASFLIASVAFSQIKYGVQFSMNLSTADIKSADFKGFTKDIKKLKGAMGVAELPVTKNFSLRTGLGYLQKGASLFPQPKAANGGANPFPASVNTTLDYLDLPWSFTYNANIKSFTLMLGAGPSFSYGLGGKVRSMVAVSIPDGPVHEVTTEVDAFKPEDKNGAGFKRFETSANALLGIRHKSGLYVSTNYLYALSNTSSGDAKYKSRNLQLNIGFMF